MYIYVYIHTHIYRERETHGESGSLPVGQAGSRASPLFKGQGGSRSAACGAHTYIYIYIYIYLFIYLFIFIYLYLYLFLLFKSLLLLLLLLLLLSLSAYACPHVLARGAFVCGRRVSRVLWSLKYETIKRGNGCILPFQPILRIIDFPSEPAKAAKHSPQSIAERG